MRELGFLSFALLANLSLAIKFTTPPSFEHTTDFSANPVYKEGSLLKIKWSATTQNATSLTLWQLNGTQFLQPFEYLTRMSATEFGYCCSKLTQSQRVFQEVSHP